MIDLPSVKVSGAVSVARARVLWQDGMLRVYTKKGRVEELRSTEPKRMHGMWPRWAAETNRGQVVFSSRCPSCGGWTAVTRINREELWAT